MMRRLWPDSLAGRIALLLFAAILAANLFALVVLGIQRQAFDQRIDESREIERIATLVPAMEAVGADVRQGIARDASTRFARVQVNAEPAVVTTASDSRSRDIAARLSETLGGRDVAVAVFAGGAREDRPGARDNGPRNPERSGPHDVFSRDRNLIAISIALTPQGTEGQWLNVVTSGVAPDQGFQAGAPFFTVMALSVLFVVGVAVWFATRLTRPLRNLAAAASAAGRGDRTARVPEEGAREVRAAAVAFNTMQGEIAQFDAERLRTLAAVGHDLRTPMTSLRIRAEMIDDESLREPMIRTLEEMTVMADGLVSYAQEGRETEVREPLDLAALLTRVCADRGAILSGTPPATMIEGRPVGLTRVFGNLIDNALRYGTDATLTLTRTRKTAVVTVDDTGPGIPEDRLDAVFEPFTRGDDSRSLDTGGAGLGLSIARTIVAAHGGDVTLANRDGGGLRATVTLPLAGSAKAPGR